MYQKIYESSSKYILKLNSLAKSDFIGNLQNFVNSTPNFQELNGDDNTYFKQHAPNSLNDRNFK